MGADSEPDAGTGDALEVQREQAVKHAHEADLIPLVRVGGWSNVLVRSDIVRYRPERVSAAAPCLSESSRKTRRAQENAECIGGMRSPWKTVRKLPRLRVAARKVREVLEQEFAKDADLANVVDLLGKEVVAGSVSHEWVSAKASDLGQKLVRALGGRRIEKDPTIGGMWNVELVSAFIDAAGDPEGDLVEWLRTGCPAGVAKEITSCGIFPATEPDDVSQLERWRLVDEEPSSNYKSVEEAVELSGAEVDRLIEKGYAVKYESWQDVIEALGEVLVSKLACIVKTREDGTLKVRNVLDLRRSGYNDGVQLRERIVLPRVKDLVEDVCDLKRCAGNSEECYGMVADFEDAFHTLQVDPSEWRYLVARHPVKGFVGYRTVLCGGAGCPLLWGRAAAFLGRSGQSLFCERELRTQIYVDDPATIVRGSLTKARECAALLLWWWLALGLQISWKKGSFGQEFRWIGVSVDLRFWDSVVISLPRSFADSVLELIAGILGKTSVPIEAIQRLAGKAGWAAGIAPVLWSQVAPLWAACADVARLQVARASEGVAKRAKVGVCRIRQALVWLHALFASKGSELVRRVPVSEQRGPIRVRFYVDASPWGGGAFLSFDGAPVEYWHDAWTSEDAQKFNVEIGSSSGQAIWESLAMLISLRVWKQWWWDCASAMVAKSDSKAALGAFEKARSKSAHINVIAREFAFDVALATYEPQFVFEHVRGKNNEWADALSRLAMPGTVATIPGPLRGLPRAETPARTASFWRTADHPESVMAHSASDCAFDETRTPGEVL